MQFVIKIYNNNRPVSYTIVRSFLGSKKRGCISARVSGYMRFCDFIDKGVDEVLTSTWVLLMNA